MKKQFKVLTILTVIFSLFLANCSKDDEVKFMSADEAKVEIRSASQDVMTAANDMLNTPAMGALMNLMNMMGFNDVYKAALKSRLSDLEKLDLHTFKSALRDQVPLKGSGPQIDPTSKGVYTYNFNTNEFALTNASVNYLRFVFPADEAAFNARNNNASLTLSNVEFITITHTDDWGSWEETIPTRANVELLISNASVMTIAYQGAFDNEGMPTSVSLSVNMTPYALNLNLSKSGNNYSSNMSFKKGNEVLIAYNLSGKYDPNYEEFDKLSGYVQVTPLKFEGSINVSEIDYCDDIDCMNQNIDVKLKHTALNQYIGKVEFRMYTDPYWQDTYPEPVIVYGDGSWEYLKDIFEDLFGDTRKMKFLK